MISHLRGDERDGLGVVEAEAPGEALLCEEAGVVQRQLLRFPGRQPHLSLISRRHAKETEEPVENKIQNEPRNSPCYPAAIYSRQDPKTGRRDVRIYGFG